MIGRAITRTFLRGLFVVLPIGLTIYVIWWLAAGIEGLVRRLLEWANEAYGVPIGWYLPGVGLVLAVVAVFGIGVAMSTWVIRRLWDVAESLIERTPGLKTVYGAIRDFVAFFNQDGKGEFDCVVLVHHTQTDMKQIGFITRATFDGLAGGAALGSDDRVAVYLPMSYQIGGFTVFVPRSRVEPIDMKMEDAMRLVLTAAVASK